MILLFRLRNDVLYLFFVVIKVVQNFWGGLPAVFVVVSLQMACWAETYRWI